MFNSRMGIIPFPVSGSYKYGCDGLASRPDRRHVAYWLTGAVLKLSRQRQLLADILAFSAIVLLGLLSYAVISIVGVANLNPSRFLVVFVGIIALLRVARIFTNFGSPK